MFGINRIQLYSLSIGKPKNISWRKWDHQTIVIYKQKSYLIGLLNIFISLGNHNNVNKNTNVNNNLLSIIA